MPASLDHIHPGTPMGANLIAGGATFRVWAPNARSVDVIGDFNNRERNDASLLNRDDHGHWLGFIPGVRERHRYMFYVMGDGGEARPLTHESCKRRFPANASFGKPISLDTRPDTSRLSFITS
jgi:1,4-alpha-glucan branching enzyme